MIDSSSALAALVAHPEVDAARTAAIGFCLGGTMALELARDGGALLAVVGFHGGLATQQPAEAGGVRTRYDAAADARSWAAMRQPFSETLDAPHA